MLSCVPVPVPFKHALQKRQTTKIQPCATLQYTHAHTLIRTIPKCISDIVNC